MGIACVIMWKVVQNVIFRQFLSLFIVKSSFALDRFTTVWTRGRDLNYTYIDYEGVDCVIAWGSITDELVEYVHSKNTQVQHMTGDPGIDQFTNEAFRKERVNDYVTEVVTRNYDGINFDFEGSTYTQEMKDNWVLFLKELSIEFAALNPARKITLAIP